MAVDSKFKLRRATIVYWILLLYIIAALIWWAFSLLQQNAEIHALRKEAEVSSAPSYGATLDKIESQKKRGDYKYLGEGAAFLLLICIGAFYIYRSVNRQFKLQQQQQNFVMAITHELKTPLAVTKLNLETLQKYQLDAEKQKKLVQVSLQETMRLDTLINNILISSQLEENAFTVAKEELNLSALANDVVRDFIARYPAREVNTAIQEDVELKGDAMLLKLMMSNLLENANKYSAPGKAVALQLHATGKEILLQVKDEGIGIADEEKEAVFQKFYRIGNEQTRKTQGTGLGLYICKKIARDHGAGILIKDNQPAGSTFIVQFNAS